MPTKASTKRTSASKSTTSKRAPAFASPSVAQGGGLHLPRSVDPWTYCASPGVLQCLHGEVVPQLAKAYHTPGLHGNGKSFGQRGHGMITALGLDGYQPIPHDFECTAFGEAREDVELSTYLDRYEGSNGQRDVVMHVEAWRRPRNIGSMTVWDFDRDGWVDFHRRVMALIAPDGVDEAQIELATRELFRNVRSVDPTKDARSKRKLVSLLVHVPQDHAPADIKRLCEEYLTS